MKKIILLTLIIYKIVLPLQAQNPPSVKWNNIKTDHFKIIFPAEIEKEAQRIANTLEWVYDQDTKSLDVKPKLVALVLNNKSMTSNAFAALGPRRMGWYLTPPPTVNELGSIDWVSTLSIHEYRHIVQYAKNNQNFTKFMRILYGDYGPDMMRWTIPDWFFEGDAVVMETALSNGGRGRMPEFDMHIRTYALNDIKFSYNQAYLGTFRKYYPSHYHLGYPLSAYARVNFGADIWDKVLGRTSKIPFIPFAFGSSLKKYTGLNVGKLYKTTMTELKTKWETEAKELKTTEAQIINKRKNNKWVTYSYPQYDSDGNIICLKKSLQKIPAFYKIMPNGIEEKIKNTDADLFSLRNNVICWDRTSPDIRFSEQSYNDIVVLGLQTRFEKKITSKHKYLSPSLSPDSKLIAVIEHNPDQQTKLFILNALTGDSVKSFSIGNNDYIRTPVWSEDGKTLAFTHSKLNGQALSILDLESGTITKVLDYSYENIGFPVFYNQYILYNSAYSGIGNICAVDTKTRQKFQVTSRPYGAYNVSISLDKTKMLFQDFNKNGYDIAEMSLNPGSWKKIEEIKPTEQHYYKKLVEQEGNISINNSEMPKISYPITKYNKFSDGIKIHSWGFFPYYPNLEFNIYSNNYLNTLSAQGGYLYNINEKTNTGYLGISFSKYFPVFTLLSSYGQRKDSYNLDTAILNDEWQELKTGISVSLPFNLSRNLHYTNLSLKAGYSYTHTQNKESIRYLSEPRNGGFNSISTSFSFSNIRHYAPHDFSPRWAQYFNFDYSQIPVSNNYNGYLVSARTSLYFPGIFPQNSIKINGSFEKQLAFNGNDYKNNYYYSSLVAFPRGFKSNTYDKFYSLSAEYQLPICYPDISLGPILFIKRIRASAFVDYGKGYWGDIQDTYQSFGGRLIFEFNIFRYRYPFEMGVQYAYKYQNPYLEKKHGISLLIFGLPF